MEEDQFQEFYQGPHQSMMVHIFFLREDFASVVGKGEWVVLTYLVAK